MQQRIAYYFLLRFLLKIVRVESCISNFSAGPYEIYVVDERPPEIDVFILCKNGGYLNRLAGYIVCTDQSGCSVYDNKAFKQSEIISILNSMYEKNKLSLTNICKDDISRISFTGNSTWLNNIEVDFYKGYYYHPATNFLAVWGIELYMNLALQGILQELHLSDGRKYIMFNHNNKNYNLQFVREINENMWETEQHRILINRTDSNVIFVDEYYLGNLIQSASLNQCLSERSDSTIILNNTSSHTITVEMFLYISIAVNILLPCLLLMIYLCKKQTTRSSECEVENLQRKNVRSKIKDADQYTEPVHCVKYHSADCRVSKDYVVFVKGKQADGIYEEVVHPSMIDDGYI